MQTQPKPSSSSTATVEQRAGEVDLARELTSGFTARMIRRKTKKLAGRFGLRSADRWDLEQDLRMALLERADQFDPTVRNWAAFATMIVNRRIANFLDERFADKREFRHNVTSLSTLVVDPDDGELVPLGRRIGEETLERLTGVAWPHYAIEIDFEHDLEVVLSKLPEDLAALCERLKRESITDVARDLGIPRTRIYRMLARAREVFEAQGLSG